MKIHKEGYGIIPLSFLIMALLVALGWWAHFVLGALLLVGAIVLWVLIIRFFRNPDVPVVKNDRQVLSPCDGKVVVIEEVEDKVYFHGKVRQVSIFMSPLNVHVNRSPIAGVLKQVKYFPGKFLVAFDPKSSFENEHTYLVAENEHVTVGFKQIAGYVARRIRWYVKENDVVEQGAEFGFIRFGSRLDLMLPLDCEIKVALGQVVQGGVTVVAEVAG